ncbi:CYTH domain-containing protein [Sulfurovum sp.]|uniref:CYTH domain-containing protein n=1 Tax=Sulfurovum sp. TaxID=1969726 RepID=UPI002867F2BC|nr:CYTH domain-containing protein [Sulfurovum sp.]
MGIEIEHKFLIDKDKLPKLQNGFSIKQGYIQTIDHTTVRVRIRDKDAFLTIKGENKGATRLEFEYPIPINDANEMLKDLCNTSVIDKTRYLLKHEGHIWEIDIFEGENIGLVIAEIELENEDEAFTLPNWVTKEVTNDTKYFNSNLIEHPYSNW